MPTDSGGATRRTENVRTRGRAARVVERVMGATLVELGRVGYAALRVDEVAARADVNKTTVYRRWPPKAQLVAAALEGQLQDRPPIDTGSVRGDLRASMLEVLELSPSAQGLVRVVLAERTEPEVESITRRLREQQRRARIEMVKRGIARGELPEGTDPGLLVDLVSAPLQRALIFEETLSRREVGRILDVILAGAAACATPRRRRGAKRS